MRDRVLGNSLRHVHGGHTRVGSSGLGDGRHLGRLLEAVRRIGETHEALGQRLACAWLALGRQALVGTWQALGKLGKALGKPLGNPWQTFVKTFGRPWQLLERPWEPLQGHGTPVSILERPWKVLESNWTPLECVGRSCYARAKPGKPLGRLWRVYGDPQKPLKPLAGECMETHRNHWSPWQTLGKGSASAWTPGQTREPLWASLDTFRNSWNALGNAPQGLAKPMQILGRPCIRSWIRGLPSGTLGRSWKAPEGPCRVLEGRGMPLDTIGRSWEAVGNDWRPLEPHGTPWDKFGQHWDALGRSRKALASPRRVSTASHVTATLWR